MNITGLIPHTEYKIIMVASTGGGCAESPLSIYMMTDYCREYNRSDPQSTRSVWWSVQGEAVLKVL